MYTLQWQPLTQFTPVTWWKQIAFAHTSEDLQQAQTVWWRCPCEGPVYLSKTDTVSSPRHSLADPPRALNEHHGPAMEMTSSSIRWNWVELDAGGGWAKVWDHVEKGWNWLWFNRVTIFAKPDESLHMLMVLDLGYDCESRFKRLANGGVDI